MKNMKKVMMVLFFAVAAFMLSGCELEKSKEFVEDGLSITLTEDFVKKSHVSVTYYYESEKAIVTVLKEDFSTVAVAGLNKDSSLDDYAKAVMYSNSMSEDKLKHSDENDYIYFDYEKTVSGNNYYYVAVMKKGSDSFWLLNFACLAEDKADFQDTFHKWAKTIKVD